jgi:DNA-binding LacI/PurR family transcriptional regulator
VSLGHERIGAIVGPRRYWVAQRKVEGFERAVHKAFGARAGALVVESDYTVEGGHVVADGLLDGGITGIVAASDLLALGAVRAVHDRGGTVPGDVSVVGYDDTVLMAFTDPPLTTVRQPVRPMSDAAVRALLDRIAGHGACHEYVFRPELVVRSSTGPVRARSANGTTRSRSRSLARR